MLDRRRRAWYIIDYLSDERSFFVRAFSARAGIRFLYREANIRTVTRINKIGGAEKYG